MCLGANILFCFLCSGRITRSFYCNISLLHRHKCKKVAGKVLNLKVSYTIQKFFQVIRNLKRSYYLILRRFKIKTNKPRNTEIDRRTTFSTFADTRANDDDDSVNDNSVQSPKPKSNVQPSSVKYEPNTFINNDDYDGQVNAVKRKSVDDNDESRI